MKIFKLTNLKNKKVIIVSERLGGKLLRRYDKYINELYVLPKVKLNSDIDVASDGIVIKAGSFVIVDRHLGGTLLDKYRFLVGEEYKEVKRVVKKKTKKVTKKVAKVKVKKKKK